MRLKLGDGRDVFLDPASGRHALVTAPRRISTKMDLRSASASAGGSMSGSWAEGAENFPTLTPLLDVAPPKAPDAGTSWRYRRRLRIARGIWFNLSKSGASLSLGGHGATVNLSKAGKTTTLGLPGFGLSYQSSRRP
jgi:hypothetical protein